MVNFLGSCRKDKSQNGEESSQNGEQSNKNDKKPTAQEKLAKRQVAVVRRKIFLALLACIVCLVTLPLIMEFYVLKQKVDDDWICTLEVEMRFNCSLLVTDGVMNKTICESLRCCWEPDTNLCHHSSPSNYSYFVKDNIENELVLNLQEDRQNKTKNQVELIEVLKMKTIKWDNEHVEIKIFNKNDENSTTPHNILDLPEYDGTGNITNTTYNVLSMLDPSSNLNKKTDKDRFYLRVQRAYHSNFTIFNTKIGNFIFTKEYIEISTILPPGSLYGLGLSSKETLKHDLSSPNRYPLISHKGNFSLGGGWPSVHPFYLYLEESGMAHGVLFASTHALEISTTAYPALTIRVQGSYLDMHFFMGPTPKDVLRQYHSFISRPTLPPIWSLGFHMCRHSIHDAEDIIKGVRSANISQESDCISSEHTSRLMFHHLTNENDTESYYNVYEDLRKNDQRVLLFHVPHIRNVTHTEFNVSYEPFNTGAELGLFVTDVNDSFVTTNLPGNYTSYKIPDHYVLLDVFHEDMQKWTDVQYSSYKSNFDFDGIILGENTPYDVSVPLPPNDFKDPPPYVVRCSNTSLNHPVVFNGSTFIFNETICMDSVHTVDGQALNHTNVHNGYGHRHLTVVRQSIDRLSKTKNVRPFVASLSTAPGSGKYGACFGDGYEARWDMLKNAVVHLQEMSLFGIPMYGVPVCGSHGERDYDLCTRWYQFAVFNPFMITYRSIGQEPVDPYSFKSAEGAIRQAIQLRYSLTNYIYTQWYQLQEEGDLIVRPMFLEYPRETRLHRHDNQFFFGPSLMAALATKKGTTAMEVCFPDDDFYNYFRRSREWNKGKGYGCKTIMSSEYEALTFLRGGHIVPFQDAEKTIFKTRQNPINLLVALKSETSELAANGTIYIDDGESIDVTESLLVNMKVRRGYREKVTNYTMEFYNMTTYSIDNMINTTIDKIIFLGLPVQPSEIFVNGENCGKECTVKEPFKNTTYSTMCGCQYKKMEDILIVKGLTKLLDLRQVNKVFVHTEKEF